MVKSPIRNKTAFKELLVFTVQANFYFGPAGQHLCMTNTYPDIAFLILYLAKPIPF